VIDPSPARKHIWYIIIGGAIGNVVEWYNFSLYGYLAFVIAKLFFPFHNKLLSITLTFTAFALSFFARPFGGVFFGWFGDTYGRQHALVFSLVMMTIPTFLIGCLPTYYTIGIASPIWLSIFRILQGFSAGGEHTGSGIYLAEYASPHRRSLLVSIVPTSAALGILASSVTALVILHSFSYEQLLSWGWRTGYWGGALLCIVSIILRLFLPETPAFQKMQKERINHHFPFLVLLRNPNAVKSLLSVFCLASSWGVFYQILFMWMPTYLAYGNRLSNNVALQINTFSVVVFICAILVVGYCADYISRRFLLMLSCVAMLIAAYPLFILLSSGSLWQVYAAMGIFTLIFSLFIPSAFVCMIESFNTAIRYSGLSIGFNIGLAIFGGSCPLMATWLLETTGSSTAPAWYVMLFAVFALITSIFISDKRGQPI